MYVTADFNKLSFLVLLQDILSFLSDNPCDTRFHLRIQRMYTN